jgi:NADH:ubiquinone oxidoreductase subunit E
MDKVDLQIEKEDIDAILRQFEGKPSELISALQAVQEVYGYIPKECIKPVADALHVFPSQVQGVVTFYAQFSMTPRGRNIVKVCRGTACHVRGGRTVFRGACRVLGVGDGETTEDLKFTLETVACLGACALSPVMVVNKAYHGHMNAKRIDLILEAV